MRGDDGHRSPEPVDGAHDAAGDRDLLSNAGDLESGTLDDAEAVDGAGDLGELLLEVAKLFTGCLRREDLSLQLRFHFAQSLEVGGGLDLVGDAWHGEFMWILLMLVCLSLLPYSLKWFAEEWPGFLEHRRQVKEWRRRHEARRKV